MQKGDGHLNAVALAKIAVCFRVRK
jgi:hypothetical protein